MIDHAELEKLAFDRAIDKLAALRAISIIDEMEKDARAKDIIRKMSETGPIGERVRALREGAASGRRITQYKHEIATSSPVGSIPARLNLAAEKVWIRGGKGMGKTKQVKGNVGKPRKGAKPIPVR